MYQLFANADGVADIVPTLYQCFFTLPSVRVGKVFAISLQLAPASRNAFKRCSSAGVHGVFVLPFFTTGLDSWFCVRPKLTSTSELPDSPVGCAKALALLLEDPGSSISEALRFREFTGDCEDCCCRGCWGMPCVCRLGGRYGWCGKANGPGS